MSHEIDNTLKISPSLQTKSRLGGKLLEAIDSKQRAAKLETWKKALNQEGSSLRVDDSGAILAKGPETEEVDISELVTPGSKIIRSRPDGDTEWTVRGIIEPAREGELHRLKVENDNGGNMSFPLITLVARPDSQGRSWKIPVPTE